MLLSSAIASWALAVALALSLTRNVSPAGAAPNNNMAHWIHFYGGNLKGVVADRNAETIMRQHRPSWAKSPGHLADRAAVIDAPRGSRSRS